MAANDKTDPAAGEDAAERTTGGAPVPGAPERARDHDPGTTPPRRTAADDAEREQERQLAEGTESPG